MIDLTQILQAIRQVRPELLQRILGGGMQSMNGGGLQAPPNYQAMPMPEISMPRPMPMPEVSRPEAWASQLPGARGSIPGHTVGGEAGGQLPRARPGSAGGGGMGSGGVAGQWPGMSERVPPWMLDATPMPFPGQRGPGVSKPVVRPRPRPGARQPGARVRPKPRPGTGRGMVPYR